MTTTARTVITIWLLLGMMIAAFWGVVFWALPHFLQYVLGAKI